MHIPDGFIDVQTSAVFAGLAAAGVATALKGARTQLDEKTAPLAGLTAVFIFAVQMLNFPVAAGTSGHLLGAGLAAVLIGPYAATLAITIVLILQALQYAMGATATFSTSAVLSAMVGTHVLIGIGEALITGLTVSAVLASRSDLVYGWKNKNQKLEIRSAN